MKVILTVFKTVPSSQEALHVHQRSYIIKVFTPINHMMPYSSITAQEMRETPELVHYDLTCT
jgi:hypothetical protein